MFIIFTTTTKAFDLKKLYPFLIILISMTTFAEEFKCPPDTLIIDFTPSSTRERMQVCQIKVDGKFLKHGPEIIFNKDGSVKTKKYYQWDVEKAPPPEVSKVASSAKPIKTDSKKNLIVAGYVKTCALINGEVKCWGMNNSGSAKVNGTNATLTPMSVPGLNSDVQSIALSRMGIDFMCVLIKNGAKCVGQNNYGQIGDGTNKNNRSALTQVFGLNSGVEALSCGSSNTCALVNGGVQCWGSNEAGMLGDGTTIDRTTPTQVVGLTSDVQAISAGESHFCALVNGGVKCWGRNSYGQLGDGTTTDRNAPSQVIGLTTDVQAIAAGYDHTCALINGGVKCWGNNWLGELGDGTSIKHSTPTQVRGLTSGVLAISAGSNNTCALLIGGEVRCWGGNADGQIGDGTKMHRNVPTKVSGLTFNVAAISSGGNHICAMMNNDEVKCWGSNVFGQLGDGTNVMRLTPVQVIGL